MSRSEPRRRKIGYRERCNQHHSGYCHHWEIRRERSTCTGSPVFLRGQFRLVLNVGRGIHRGRLDELNVPNGFEAMDAVDKESAC